MKRIQLTQGKFAVVDDADYELLRGYSWQFLKGYAKRAIKVNGKSKTIMMHRQILGLAPGEIGDHINGDRLDNRRANLRKTDETGNARNVRKSIRRRCSSRFKGVCWSHRGRRWQAAIAIKHQKRWLGYFDTEIEAAIAYNRAAKRHFGEFASPNHIEGGHS